ncbi:NK-tumor recognition protein isoform X1 [Vespula squamosa]|uniref:NK-tumor recognition protein isoform X1 n=1 Tax=Vespula squamosa TaxID=30214 RepID=A0ABD2AJ51_VESSQ
MEVISTRRYEVRPPPTTNHHGIVVDPENSVALVKEEEWETRKKKEITTTRQIETRVKRQVVLEDGEVVVDSGPFVTTNTTEDVEQQEHTTEERRTTGDQPQEVEWPVAGKGTTDGIVQKELNETVVRSREEIEERLETEDRQQLGDISDEAYQKAVQSNRGDLRIALVESTKQVAPQTGPRIVQHTTRSNKVIDTEKTLEKQELKSDGLIVTEKKKTVEHEEINDDEVPDDGSVEDASETRKEGSQRFIKKREEDVVDYVSGGERIAREMRYVAETTEGERIGDWSPPPTNMRTTRLHKHTGFPTETTTAARKDALTKKPLDLEEEDEARKFETSKWLESHFGSESRSSHGSIDADDGPFIPNTNTSYIHVTMKSCSPREREYQNINSNRHHHNSATGRDSTSPSGYFHGISEWSERYQGKEKEDNHTRTGSPSQHLETGRTNGHSREHTKNQFESTYSRTSESVRRREHQESVQDDKQRTPSPPARRKPKEQLHSRVIEKTITNESPSIRTSSPVHVVQRTWESRSRDVQEQTVDRDARKKSTSPRSRSNSPKQVRIIREEKKTNVSNSSRPSKSTSQSKYKIGESFRKLVGKLRSASTERKNKHKSGNSISQVTQTDDDGSTYMQYNVIDKNIPLFNDREIENRLPERPPRSPRNSNVVTAKVIPSKTTKTSDRSIRDDHGQRNETIPPVHRYYLGEDPFGGSIYGRERGYKDAKRPPRNRFVSKTGGPIETEYSVATNSLGRFSKSTSRLTNAYETDDQFRNVQTLPRNMRSEGKPSYQPSSSSTRQQVHSVVPNLHGMTTSRQYGSMINISIKNAVTSTSKSHQPYPNLQAPVKPERTYKSTLARSKSFNVEADKNGVDKTINVPYKSSLQLNRLDETPPLKSPGILASISRSNRDLFKDSRRE